MPGNILIVEDEVCTIGRDMQEQLQDGGFDVIDAIADTEQSAMLLARQNRPEVVLMDIMLGDDLEAGLRAARRINSETRAQIIFVTAAKTDARLFAEANKTPGCQFLAKPVRAGQLVASVQLALARAHGKRVVFVCYSHEDAFFAEEMMKHLKGLEDFGINPWIDKQIVPSQNWRQRIEGALAEAQAAICLVSSDFISSRFIAEVELPTLLHAEAKRGLHVYPIYVNFVDGHVLDHRGLLEWQGVNGPSDPIARWEAPKRHQECWGVLCQHLRERTNP